MAEKEDPDAIQVCEEVKEMPVSTTNWWAPWLDAAKSKSTEVFEFVKKDLTEITAAVKSEANAVVNSTADVLKTTLKLEEPQSTASTMKRSVSNFLGTVSNVLNPMADDEGEEALLIQNDKPVPLSRFQTKLISMVKNPETFTKEIEPEQLPQFESWLTVGEEQMTRDRLTKMLMTSPDLHTQYETLVPEKVSHLEFWQRFLFRQALLEDEESLQEAKAKREQSQAEKVQWEKEDFAEGINLTEEEQTQILADYENEKKQKSPETTKSAPEDLLMNVKQGMVVVGDSSCVSTSSAETESKDTDDWEKDFDLDDGEMSTQNK